MEFIGDSDN
jgi:hypothetical protein